MTHSRSPAGPLSRQEPADTSRETALREILQVISTSRHDERPVFDVILWNATRLCQAPLAGLVLIDEDRRHYRMVAEHGARTDFVRFLRENPPELDPDRYAAARAMVELRAVHVDDLSDPVLYGPTTAFGCSRPRSRA